MSRLMPRAPGRGRLPASPQGDDDSLRRRSIRHEGGEWYRWGPYVSERQWGTVREDYSADANARDYLPHDQAR